jgi:hypothetical protein
MSHTVAYICDICNAIVDADGVTGVSLQPDLFDKLQSYPVIPKPEKADAHGCVECYRTRVTVPAENQCDRKRDEAGYIAKVKELGFLYRSQVVDRYKVKQTKKRNSK